MAHDTDYFNKIAPNWDKHNATIPADKINYILDIAGISAGDSILDAGTGTGVLLPFLSSRQQHLGTLHAVDSSSAMLEIAHRKNAHLLPSPVFILADIENDIIYERFNHIMLYCVFPHLHKPIETLLHLYKNNLQPGGSITIAHPTSRHTVNSIHHNCPIKSHKLKPAETVTSQLTCCGMNISYTEDSDECYIINIAKTLP